MSKINWDLVDREVFAEFRLATTAEIAQAYLDEAFLDEPNNTRLITLYEMGQGRYNERYNSREARERLFSQLVSRLQMHPLSKVGA
jgi:hypothetical protein